MIWSLLFWLATGFILYTYLGYPLCLLALRWLRRALPPRRRGEWSGSLEAARGDADLPLLSVILTVRNEEANVGAKLDNLLGLDYPAGRMEIWVASDASTDRTNEIARGYADPRVRLVEYEGGIGKAE